MTLPEHGAKHGGVPLDVQPKPAVGVLHVGQVANDLVLGVAAKHRVQHACMTSCVRHDTGKYRMSTRTGDVACDDQTREEKHGTAIVARPVAIGALQGAVKADAAPDALLEQRVGELARGGNGEGRLVGVVCHGAACLKTEELVGGVALRVAVLGKVVSQGVHVAQGLGVVVRLVKAPDLCVMQCLRRPSDPTACASCPVRIGAHLTAHKVVEGGQVRVAVGKFFADDQLPHD